MRAAVLNNEHAFEVSEVPDPTPGPDQLVLRVRACGICGSDLKAYSAMPAGAVLGHEFCGEIVAVGTGVSPDWSAGQFVAAMPLSACGRCRWCLTGELSHCDNVDLLGLGGTSGAFAEYVRVAATSTVALAEGVDELGALVEPLAVGLHAVTTADLRPGDRVLVIGGGSVGAAVALWARRLGAREVVISDPLPSRRASADRFGATGVHDPTDGPVASGFDVVFECVGLPGMVQAAMDAATKRGRVVIAGVCMVPDQIIPVTALLKEVQVRFAVYYRADEFATAAQLLGSGGIDASLFVSGDVGLDGVNEAFDAMQSSSRERKILVRPGT